MLDSEKLELIDEMIDDVVEYADYGYEPTSCNRCVGVMDTLINCIQSVIDFKQSE